MIRSILQSEVRNALGQVAIEVDVARVTVERSERFGDYTTSIALSAAKIFKRNPLEVAEDIKRALLASPTGKRYMADIQVAPPGFINITLTPEAIAAELASVAEHLEKKQKFDFLKKQNINIEFVSANPTGELHIGHGRNGFYGDILARILSYTGADVTREFYINDSKESKQIIELGKTAKGIGEQYKTEKLLSLINGENFSKKTEAEAGLALAQRMQDYNKKFLEGKLSIHFDTWYSEEENLRASGANEKMLERLKQQNFVYKKDRALWIKTSEYGDDEDRVVVRSDGTKSYFLSDIAYHDEKFSRKLLAAIDVWGADHHGHVKRMEAVKKMLGWKGELRIFITQLVALKEGGERKKMSKRAGTAVLLEDLVNELGIDVVRWFFAEKSLGVHMDFDIERAREQSEKNPVYYVQYAHARIASILRNIKGISADKSKLNDYTDTPSGKLLSLKIIEFPEVLYDITKDYQIHKLTAYAYNLASAFSQFYRDVRIINEKSYRKGALELVEITQHTLAQTLALLGISAPERM